MRMHCSALKILASRTFLCYPRGVSSPNPVWWRHSCTQSPLAASHDASQEVPGCRSHFPWCLGGSEASHVAFPVFSEQRKKDAVCFTVPRFLCRFGVLSLYTSTQRGKVSSVNSPCCFLCAGVGKVNHGSNAFLIGKVVFSVAMKRMRTCHIMI